MARKITKKYALQYLKDKIATDSKWAIHALMYIYSQQTEVEKDMEQTCQHNTVGFSGLDSGFLTSLAKQYQNSGSLSPRQKKVLKEHMPRYAGQILRLRTEYIMAYIGEHDTQQELFAE